MLTIERLIALGGIIKWSTLFSEAGLNPNTMRSAMYHRRPLRRDETAALLRALRAHGIHLSTEPEPSLFGETEREWAVPSISV